MGGNTEIGRVVGPPETGFSVPVGSRVWLMTTGRSGRVVARAQGGLLYRVRLEGAAEATAVVCPGGDLLPLAGEDATAG